MKLRTFTALLLAAIMLFALTACGSQAADDSSSASIFSFAVMIPHLDSTITHYIV